MATSNVPPGTGGDNPATITELEPAIWLVAPDHDTGGVTLEVADQSGNGFRTVFDQGDAIDIAVRIVGAVARIRGWSTP